MELQTRSSVKEKLLVKEVITFSGHPMVSSLHPTTIEITTEDHLTLRGDCIVGVSAEKGCLQLDEHTKEALRSAGAHVSFKIRAEGEEFTFNAWGDPGLELSNPNDIVIRKSGFLSDRTLAVGASAAAIDLPRSLVSRLKRPDTVGRLEIEVSSR